MTAGLLIKSILMGLDHALAKRDFAALEIESLPFKAAVEYMTKKMPLSKDEYYKKDNQAKFRAFTVSRIADGAILEKVKDLLSRNMKEKSGFSTFLKQTDSEILDSVGMGTGKAWYWETVYRTNVQTAYNVGRAIGFDATKPLALEFVGLEDGRQTEICRRLSEEKIILPYGDPFWNTHTPPLHFGCRSTLRAIYDPKELPEEFTPIDDSKPLAPAKGFGETPLLSDKWWQELPSMRAQAVKFGVQGEINSIKSKLKITANNPQDSKPEPENKEANEYAMKTLNIPRADYRGLPAEVANEWNKDLKKYLDEFPETRKLLEFVGECHARNKAMKEKYLDFYMPQTIKEVSVKWPWLEEKEISIYAKSILEASWRNILRELTIEKDVIAQCYIATSEWSKGFSGITINKNVVTDYNEYLKDRREDVQTKYHPIGTDSIKGDFDHEMAHLLDELLDISKNNDIIKLYESLSSEQIIDGLSEYASTSNNGISEFIAEAWSEFRNNEVPRKIAKSVGDIITEMYKAWKKKNL